MAKDYKWKKPYSLGEMENASFDESSRLMKRAAYGWDGSSFVALRVNNSGELIIDTTNLDSRYLKLDASNDPITGDLTFSDGLYLAVDTVRARDGDGLKLYDDGGNGIFVEDGGNVGIGTTSPAAKLDVRTNFNVNDELFFNEDGGGGGVSYGVLLIMRGNPSLSSGYVALVLEDPTTDITTGDLPPDGDPPTQFAYDPPGDWGFGANATVIATNNAPFVVVDNDYTTAFYLDPAINALRVGDSSLLGTTTDLLVDGDVGIGTTTPDAKLQVVGDTMFGDDGTNYASFASDGELTLHGTARVTRDLWIDAAGIKAPGAKPATEVSFGTLETSAWEFSDEGVEANQESVSWRIAIPYDMDRTEGVILRIGWSSASTGNCKWQLKYRWFSQDEDMTQDGEETLTAVDAASATANGLVITTIEGINAPSATDATIMFKLTRLSADAEDTISDTVELHGVCFNYTSDKLGEAI